MCFEGMSNQGIGESMADDRGELTTRKLRHIDVCRDGDVNYQGLTTGLERYRLPYNALTQTSLDDIDLSVEFFGARCGHRSWSAP